MASGQLPGIHQKRSMASKFAGPMEYGLPSMGCDIGSLSQAPPKPKSITELKEALQVIWDSVPQEPINKATKSSTLY